jgi:kexin
MFTNPTPRGESGVGTWTIIVKDTNVNKHSGTFVDWHLKLWGESRDPAKAQILPMPTEEDDNDHASIATTTLGASTTTIPTTKPTDDAPPADDATDVPGRPVMPKPTGANTDDPEAEAAQSTAAADGTANKTGGTTWLPSFLPTFGVSAATQAWIYGSLVLIVLFCAGLAVYFYLARRARLRNNPRNDYEFELLDDEEAEGLAGGGGAGGREKVVGAAAAAAAGGRRRTRGGELYDAFAGESDDDDGDLSDDEFGGGGAGRGVGGQYRDRSGSGSDGSGSPIRMSEKLPGRRDSDESAEHHVVGDEDDEDDEEGQEARPLQGGNR